MLREGPLRAVQAEQTMLTRMVLFVCRCCRERFQTFHPAFVPPEDLSLHLTARGGSGVAACNIEVARWEEVPPLPEVGPSGGAADVADVYRGICLGC